MALAYDMNLARTMRAPDGDPAQVTSCRDARRTLSERDLVGQLAQPFADTTLSPQFVTTLYLALKTAQVVVISGGRRARFVIERYIGALLGSGSTRYQRFHTSSRGASANRHEINERFMAMRLLDQIGDASAIEGAGHCFFCAVDHVQLDDLSAIFESLLTIGTNGRLTLAATDTHDARQIDVPTAVRIAILLEDDIDLNRIPTALARQVAVIDIPPDALITAPPRVPVSAVGYERLLRRAFEQPSAGRTPWGANRVRGSDDLVRLFWRAGETLTDSDREQALLMIGAAFDATQVGLFDPDDAQYNATIAYDSYLLTRVAWRLRRHPDPEIQRDLLRLTAIHFGPETNADRPLPAASSL
jgi:hypothetical protein